MSVDLHVHSTASDGVWTPLQVVEQALASRVDLLALTDHDSIQGALEILEPAKAAGIHLVPAAEFNTDVPGHEIDILGYFYAPPVDPALLAIFQRRTQARIDRAREIIARLLPLGVDVSYERVREIAAGIIARPHIVQAMMETGYVHSQKEAYDRYVGLGAPAFVEHDPFHPTEAIMAVRRAGGIPVVAHPGLIGDDALIQQLIDAGLGGLEAYYPEHSPEQVIRYRDWAGGLGLLVTAGSDCHGPGRKKSYPLGSMDLPAKDRAAFLAALEAAWAKQPVSEG